MVVVVDGTFFVVGFTINSVVRGVFDAGVVTGLGVVVVCCVVVVNGFVVPSPITTFGENAVVVGAVIFGEVS